MTAAEWVVTVAGAFLIAFELWFFLGKPPVRAARGLAEEPGTAQDGQTAGLTP